MRLHLEWGREILLNNARSDNMIYDLDLAKVPDHAGIYVFGRRWGKQFEALYVGEAKRLRTRARQQLNNLRLMQHLHNAKNGKRVLLAGKLVTKGGRAKGGRSLPQCLKLAERAFIRHVLSEGHDLVNTQGTRLRRHAVMSSGRHPKRYFPKEMHLEKTKAGTPGTHGDGAQATSSGRPNPAESSTDSAAVPNS